MYLSSSSSKLRPMEFTGEDDPTTVAAVDSAAAPTKKRAETWNQEETRVLITLRREIDSAFNTSKSNKHLWEGISNRMRDKGFDRSPTMCTDKWRNLLKEFKKCNQRDNLSLSHKMTCYRELDELLRERGNNGVHRHKSQSPPPANAASSKLNMFIQFSDNGFGDGNIPFGLGEADSGPTVNIERNLDHDDDPLALTAADAVGANDVPPWNWRENPEDGGEQNTEYGGRVITVKWGVHVRKIGIDGSREAIKEAIKSTFRLRTNRAFWLEDEFSVTRSFDRSMPLGEYTLHVDEGISIKLCIYDERLINKLVRTVDKTLYNEDHFREFLTSSGFVGLREINGFTTLDDLNDIQPGLMYRGVPLTDFRPNMIRR